MGNWSELPLDLLELIEGHMTLYIDKVRIRALCASWNSHLSKMPNHKVKQLPWMLQALDNKREASHGLFNPLDKKIYEVNLPEAQGKLFKGSSFGWVVTVEDLDSNSLNDMYLINPLTRTRIKLPPRSKFPDVKSYHADKVGEEYVVFTHDYFDAEGFRPDPLFGGFDSEEYDSGGSEEFDEKLQIVDSHFVSKSLTWKVVLSSTPYDDNCILVAIYGQSHRLAYCKCNDKKWRSINVGEYGIGVLDVIFHKGKLHAINDFGDLLVFENIGVDSDIKVTEEVVSMRPTQTAYLTECFDGELIVVKRYFDFSCIIINDPKDPLPQTNGFEVYKLDSMNSSWVKDQNIGDDILFLGLNSSLTISSHDLLGGHKGNRIYFTDYIFSFDIKKGQEEDPDVGVFNIEDGTFQSMPGFKCHPRFLWPPPPWVKIV